MSDLPYSPPPVETGASSSAKQGFFRTNDKRRTFHQWLQSISERCEQWGKLRVTDGGDCIRSGSATNALSFYGKMDASFIKNLRNNKEIKMIKVFGLDFILTLTLPAGPEFGVDEPQFHILAHMTKPRMRADPEVPRSNGFHTRNLDNRLSSISRLTSTLSAEWRREGRKQGENG
ncbi:hypothetical protein RhiJN_05262 [Ceratobasidium sp. AG-Ba]|nr:hypothetical protein RhiJN_05262 [Ceratobasidium sp. AG-Ba]QRW06177.1 hypothetical protein RhiLY_05176 [Ceratobasidium sp. AG-Ba]